MKAWKQRWETSLSPDKARLYHFMRRDRVAETRSGGPACGSTEYNFTIDGTERSAAEACGEYLALLEGMLARFVTRRAEDTIDQLIAAARSDIASQLTSIERDEEHATGPALVPLPRRFAPDHIEALELGEPLKRS